MVNKDKKADMWTTKSGSEIKISDMTDSHLKNAYFMLIRSKGIDYTPLRAELISRGMTKGLPLLSVIEPWEIYRTPQQLIDDDWLW